MLLHGAHGKKRYPSLSNSHYYYLRQTDEGINQLVRHSLNLDKQDTGSAAELVSPEGFNLKTRINEYGGKPYRLVSSKSEQACLLVNDMDGCLYYLELTGELTGNANKVDFSAFADQQIHSTGDLGDIAGFGDFQVLDNEWLISIVDRKPHGKAQEHSMTIELASRKRAKACVCLRRGADFYSNLVLSPDSKYLAWVEWNHPNMPWDDTRAFVAQLIKSESGEYGLHAIREVSFGEPASICQLEFADESTLCFAADFSNSQGTLRDFSNIYALDLTENSLKPSRITDFEGEFAYPHWQYTDARIKRVENGELYAILSKADCDQLLRIDLRKGLDQANTQLVTADAKASWFQSIDSDGSKHCIVREYTNDDLVKLTLSDGLELSDLRTQQNPLNTADISVGEHIQYPSSDADFAYGYYYPPVNSSYQKSADQLPPLLVMVHGGPTARAYGFLDLQKQFWTSNGFAVLDVNHRGSSGYGRAFRDALYGGWGEKDTSDVVSAIKYLADAGKVDPNGIVIRGKSAGGYAVLSAITHYAEVFAAGASYYGIGNLVTLCQLTHKFEKHYTDQLIGEVFDDTSSSDEQSAFYQRSPVNFVDQVRCPLVILQGADDKVVPPELAREMVEALNKNKIPNDYIEYPGEGHGFKRLETNVDAWQKEINFYREVLSRDSN